MYEEESARVAAIGMSSNPFCNLAAEVGRNRNIAVALVCLCSPNAILSSLTLLDRFVDSELCSLKIVNAQSESLAGAQTLPSRGRSTFLIQPSGAVAPTSLSGCGFRPIWRTLISMTGAREGRDEAGSSAADCADGGCVAAFFAMAEV